MTNVELFLTKAGPGDLYTSGAVEDVKGALVKDGVRAALGNGDVVPLRSGFYTYMFSVTDKGSVTIQVIDADTHVALQQAKPIDASQHLDGHTYSFVVP
jgi:hypothetical protein